jgi:L-2-amino-thiazoline-4-carboxylic acid hydrolase-like protein
MIQASRSSRAVAQAVAGRLFGAVPCGISHVDMALAEGVESTIREDAARLAEINAARAIDGPSQRWLMVCCLTLATYRVLKPFVGDGRTVLELLQDALAQPLKTNIKEYVAERFAVSQDAPSDAFDRVSQHFTTRGEERFGQAFEYVQDVQDATRSFTKITKCFFNDFFRANDAPEVTPIFCALDFVWADELADVRYALRFERPTTLAAGDDACRFQFFKVLAPGTP